MDIINKLKTFNEDEHKQALKILLTQPNIKYSENKNGTFFNFNDIEQPVLDQLIQYIQYVEKKEDDIQCMELKVNKYRTT